MSSLWSRVRCLFSHLGSSASIGRTPEKLCQVRSHTNTHTHTERDRHPPTEKERDGETRTHECKHQFYSALVDLISPFASPAPVALPCLLLGQWW